MIFLAVIVKTGDGQLEIVFSANLSDPIWKLKEYVSTRTRISPSDIQLSFSGESLSNDGLVSELGVNAGTTLDLLLVLPLRPSVHPGGEVAVTTSMNNTNKEPVSTSYGVEEPVLEGEQIVPQEYVMPTAFTIQLTSDKESKEILVVVEKAKSKKPFLGGYRHKQSGAEYHHAATQTPKPSTASSGVEKSQRETQTYLTRNMHQQTQCDAATQMTKTGCFVSHTTDKILFPGEYETAEEYHRKRLEAVVVLQTHVRRWLAERYVNILRKEKVEHERWMKEEEASRQKEREERIKREFDRRMNPKTKEDFEVLYHALEMWRIDELTKINETTSGPERKAALCGLLEQEAQLIASIGQHKILANQENKVASTRKLLDNMAAPRRWIAFDGRATEMDTPYSLRAHQLKEMYLSLTSSDLDVEERKDLLMSVRATVSEHDCKLTRDIVDLVDREADFLDRHMPVSTMDGLRKRISTLFLQYVKTPHFNAAAASHIKVPPDPSVLHSKIYYCRSCCSYLPSVEFQLSTNAHAPGHCRKCVELDNKARHREDHTLYRSMLRSIRHSEEQYKDGSRVVFLLQDMDLKHLVEGIWGGQSVLSAESDLFELKMVRWERDKEWSPWNCILLTKQEATYHHKLENVLESYGPVFADKVKQRHVLARSYFTHLPHFVSQMESKVKDIPFLRGPERVVTIATQKTSKDVPSEG